MEQAAQLPDLDLSCVCDGNILKLITSHAHSLGVPNEYIFFPLLSTVSGLLNSSCVEVHEGWRERTTIWCGVVGKRGSRRSATVGRFASSVNNLKKTAPHFHAPNISVDSIPTHLLGPPDPSPASTTNLCFFENFSELFNVLDLDRPQIGYLKLRKSYDYDPLDDTSFAANLGGFFLPESLGDLFHNLPIEIASRFVVTWPKPVLYSSKDLKVPMAANIPSLNDVFKVLWHKHQQPITYTLSPTAKAAIDQFSDAISDRFKDTTEDEGRYCHLMKTPGQLARIACVLGALRQALKYVVYHEDLGRLQWNTVLTHDDVEAARIIMVHILRVKTIVLSLVDRKKYDVANNCTSGNSTSSICGSTNKPDRPVSPLEPSPKRHRLSSDSQYSIPASTISLLNLQAAANHYTAAAAVNNAAHYLHAQSRVPEINPAAAAASNLNMFKVPQGSQAAAAQHELYQQQQQPPVAPHTPQASSSKENGHVSASSTPDSNGGHWGRLADPQGNGSIESGIVVKMESNSGSSGTPDGISPGENNRTYKNHLDQYLGLFTESNDEFVTEHAVKVKKLLEFRMDYRVSPSTCAQRHLIPPLTKKDMIRYDTQTKYPVQVAKEFLLKVADLGFGHMETVIHPANKRRSTFFQKRRYEQLPEEARTILERLAISEMEYMSAFQPIENRESVFSFPYPYNQGSQDLSSGQLQMANAAALAQAAVGQFGGLSAKQEPLDMPSSDDSQVE